MVKVMLLLKRRPGMSLAEFIERYESVHVPLAEKHVKGLARYARHYLHPSAYDMLGEEIDEPAYDVLTELWYENMEGVTAQQESNRNHPERMADIIADEEQLFDRSKSRMAFVEDRVSDLGARAPLVDLETGLRQLLDKDAIVDLVHRYSHCVDRQLHDELVELFTEDCVVDYGPGQGEPLRGRAALREAFRSGAGMKNFRPDFIATSHHNANVLVTFETADRARVVTSLYAWHGIEKGPGPEVWGCYHDLAVRTPGGWRLAERQLRVAGNTNWDIDFHPLVEDAG